MKEEDHKVTPVTREDAVPCFVVVFCFALGFTQLVLFSNPSRIHYENR